MVLLDRFGSSSVRPSGTANGPLVAGRVHRPPSFTYRRPAELCRGGAAIERRRTPTARPSRGRLERIVPPAPAALLTHRRPWMFARWKVSPAYPTSLLA